MSAAASRPGAVLVREDDGPRPPFSGILLHFSFRGGRPPRTAAGNGLAPYPITPFMPHVPAHEPALHYERSFTNMAQSMAADKPPNRNSRRGMAE